MVDNEAFSFHISELLAVLVKLLALLTLPNLLDLPEWMELRSELLNKMNSVSITKLKTLRDWMRYLRKKKPQAHLKDKIISHFLKNFILGFRNFNTYMDRRVVNQTSHFIKWRFTWKLHLKSLKSINIYTWCLQLRQMNSCRPVLSATRSTSFLVLQAWLSSPVSAFHKTWTVQLWIGPVTCLNEGSLEMMPTVP